jgi:hypothetical protein
MKVYNEACATKPCLRMLIGEVTETENIIAENSLDLLPKLLYYIILYIIFLHEDMAFQGFL